MTRCYNITILDNSLPGNSASKLFRLHLSSATSGVLLPANDLPVAVVDDEGAPPTLPVVADELSATAAAIGVLLAVFLVVAIFIVILVILMIRRKRSR